MEKKYGRKWYQHQYNVFDFGTMPVHMCTCTDKMAINNVSIFHIHFGMNVALLGSPHISYYSNVHRASHCGACGSVFSYNVFSENNTFVRLFHG